MSIQRHNLISELGQRIRSNARLLYISVAKCGEDWSSEPHAHTNAELFYILGGKGSFLLSDKSHPVEKDDLVVINPRVQHCEASDEAQPLEYIVLGVDGLELTASNDNQQQIHVINLAQSGIPIRAYLDEMLRELEDQIPGYETICQDLLEVLLLRVMRYSNYSAQPLPPAKRVSKECAAARRYIEAHFRENLTLDQLAEIVHINKYHMVHSFTKAFGVSPINYLLSLRLQECRYLLQSTDQTMTQISQAVGFSSPCYFSQVFHKATGMSPREYRNTYRQGME